MNRRSFIRSAAFAGTAVRSAADTEANGIPVKAPQATSGDLSFVKKQIRPEALLNQCLSERDESGQRGALRLPPITM
jgi:hypothetical protein